MSGAEHGRLTLAPGISTKLSCRMSVGGTWVVTDADSPCCACIDVSSFEVTSVPVCVVGDAVVPSGSVVDIVRVVIDADSPCCECTCTDVPSFEVTSVSFRDVVITSDTVADTAAVVMLSAVYKSVYYIHEFHLTLKLKVANGQRNSRPPMLDNILGLGLRYG